MKRIRDTVVVSLTVLVFTLGVAWGQTAKSGKTDNVIKQEIISDPRVATRNDIQPKRYGDAPIPNLIRRSYNGDLTGRTSAVNSETGVSANGRQLPRRLSTP